MQPLIGPLAPSQQIRTCEGKMVFISKSAPFTKDGKQMVRISSATNPARQQKKQYAKTVDVTVKRLKKLSKRWKRINKVKAEENAKRA